MTTEPTRPDKQWPIPCRDAAGRTRELSVFGDLGRAVLIFPPGEFAVLTTTAVAQLRHAMHQAAEKRTQLP
jgi:hypothetical protein